MTMTINNPKNLGEAMVIHIRHIVLSEHRPFSYLDFLVFVVDGIVYEMNHGTFRNKVSELIKNVSIKLFVIHAMVMCLSEKESMKYLSDRGFKISVNHFYRLKRRIQQSRFDRLNLIAKSQFVDEHLERIDQLELINSEMWLQYRREKDPFKQVLILEKIAELQTYISPYYDASHYILEKSIIQENDQKKNNSIPSV